MLTAYTQGKQLGKVLSDQQEPPQHATHQHRRHTEAPWHPLIVAHSTLESTDKLTVDREHLNPKLSSMQRLCRN